MLETSPDLNTGTTFVSFQHKGKCWEIKIWLNMFKSRLEMVGLRSFNIKEGIESTPEMKDGFKDLIALSTSRICNWKNREVEDRVCCSGRGAKTVEGL